MGNLMIVFKNYVLELEEDSCARTDLTTIWPATTPFFLKEETEAPQRRDLFSLMYVLEAEPRQAIQKDHVREGPFQQD